MTILTSSTKDPVKEASKQSNVCFTIVHFKSTIHGI